MLSDPQLLSVFKDVPQCNHIASWCESNSQFSDFLQSPEVAPKIVSIVSREKGNQHKLLDRLSELKFAYNLLKLSDYRIVKYESPLALTKRTIDFHVASPYGEFNVEVARINPNPLDKLRELIVSGLSKTLKPIESKYTVYINDFIFDWPVNSEDSRNSRMLLRQYSDAQDNKGVITSAIRWLSGMMIGVLNRLATEKMVEDNYSFPIFEFVDNSNTCHQIKISLSIVYHLSEDNHVRQTNLHMPIYSCNYTGFEYEKYGNRIMDKIEQFSEGRPNLFIMHSDSDTHDPGYGVQSEFISGINRCLNRLVITKTDQESVNAISYLSACLLVTPWSSFDYSQCIWFNKHANAKISERILFDVYGAYHGL